MCKIACWNVNSIRSRKDHIIDWINQLAPDILALQETKVRDEDFPEKIFFEIGYGVIYFGQPSYNGVAIAYKKSSFQDPTNINKNIPELLDNQSRLISGLFTDKRTGSEIKIICIYVPNGSDIGTEKFFYKLNWLKYFLKFIKEEKREFSNICVLGDFNIAPSDIDVHDPAKWKNKILCSMEERSCFQDILEQDFFDSYRFHNQDSGSYSWWDYRQASFRRNLGLRIDHILLSETLKNSCVNSGISIKPRKLEKPSDHAPCWTEVNL
ncbi:MAG: exodeoxyribonuclease III [Betaproteobacteria bacterium TMED156]|nr:MAG: exodeoxyribonuclease III [Betaproteobacteria bacterium TMED156]